MNNLTDKHWYTLCKAFLLRYGGNSTGQAYPANQIVQSQQDFNALNGYNDFILLRVGHLEQIPIIPEQNTLVDLDTESYIAQTKIMCILPVKIECYGALAIETGQSMWGNIENYQAMAWIRNNYDVSYYKKTDFINVTNQIGDQVLYATRKQMTITFTGTQESMFKIDAVTPKYDGYFVI